MPNNLEIYQHVRNVPDEAKKPITAGRLKGKTNINPMWRIRTLTEEFGPVGIGWYYDIDRVWLESGANDEITANVQVSLYIKASGDVWSKPIRGVGGSMLVEKEKLGMHTDDDCYKKALTDAISVACKALGIGADVYWDEDPTKYDAPPEESPKPEPPRCEESPKPEPPRCVVCGTYIKGINKGTESYTAEEVAAKIKAKHGRVICKKCQDAFQEEEHR